MLFFLYVTFDAYGHTVDRRNVYSNLKIEIYIPCANQLFHLSENLYFEQQQQTAQQLTLIDVVPSLGISHIDPSYKNNNTKTNKL